MKDECLVFGQFVIGFDVNKANNEVFYLEMYYDKTMDIFNVLKEGVIPYEEYRKLRLPLEISPLETF